LNSTVTPSLLPIWRQSLSIPIIASHFDPETESRELTFCSQESIYFYGFLADRGIVCPTSRLAELADEFPDPLFRSRQAKALSAMIPGCARVICERFRGLWEALLAALPPGIADEAVKFVGFDGVLTAAQPAGFDPSPGRFLSFPGYVHMVISADDGFAMREIAAMTDFDVNGRLAQSLVNCSAMLNSRPTFLLVAAFYGSVECFNFLLASGADPLLTDLSRKRRGIAEFAVVGGSGEILRQCERFGRPISHFLAVSYHRNDVFFWRIDGGAQIDARGEDGLTLMDRAAASNNVEIVRFLYLSGSKARLSLSDGYQSTFAVACQFDCLAVVQEIIENEEVPVEVLRDGFEEAVRADSADVIDFLRGRMG
jgi:hypothetical protein